LKELFEYLVLVLVLAFLAEPLLGQERLLLEQQREQGTFAQP
jgi:hypothetical protein